MRRILHTSLAIGATALALGTAYPARADFIYTLTSTAIPGGPGAPTHLDMQLTMADAAVESGSFVAVRNCSSGSCISNSGNFDEITLTLTSPFAAILINNSPDLSNDQTNVSLTFGPAGDITSGSIFEVNSFFGLEPLTITNSSWSATFNSDAFMVNAPRPAVRRSAR
jgi:hypothetical protein